MPLKTISDQLNEMCRDILRASLKQLEKPKRCPTCPGPEHKPFGRESCGTCEGECIGCPGPVQMKAPPCDCEVCKDAQPSRTPLADDYATDAKLSAQPAKSASKEGE